MLIQVWHTNTGNSRQLPFDCWLFCVGLCRNECSLLGWPLCCLLQEKDDLSEGLFIYLFIFIYEKIGRAANILDVWHK